MFNSSSFNVSANVSTLGEFPYWKEALSYILVTELFIYSPLALFINGSLLFTILKTKSLRKPLNLIHVSLLFLNCLIVLPDAIATCVYIPPVIRFCSCPRAASSVYFAIELLYIVFQPLNYASLGIFQLLIIKGKKRFVTTASVAVAVTICNGIAILLVSEAAILINLADQTYICNGFCPGEMSGLFPGIAIAFSTYTFISWIPSLLVVAVCATWSCVIFRKAYIGDSDQLNRRIISLPVVMPCMLVLPTILSNTFLSTAEEAITSTESDFATYWVLFNRLLAFQIHEFISGIAYPLVLLLLNPKIGRCWKEMVFNRCGKHSSVVPSSSGTDI